jgi:hypothetical protein
MKMSEIPDFGRPFDHEGITVIPVIRSSPDPKQGPYRLETLIEIPTENGKIM